MKIDPLAKTPCKETETLMDHPQPCLIIETFNFPCFSSQFKIYNLLTFQVRCTKFGAVKLQMWQNISIQFFLAAIWYLFIYFLPSWEKQIELSVTLVVSNVSLPLEGRVGLPTCHRKKTMPLNCFKAFSQFVMENVRLQLLKLPSSLNVSTSHNVIEVFKPFAASLPARTCCLLWQTEEKDWSKKHFSINVF